MHREIYLATFILILLSLAKKTTAQETSFADPVPSLNAFIVNNIDSTIIWYQDIFRFEFINKEY